ncbi:nuclear transport factor 2 family protein [Jiangella alkaliphila]|uniref:SnoaL-like domain-containing protein n=1 Tax=Jiangella alkaliphila TaxID=419479 RepID=A0A1H2FWS5_9ACTN|nr:nuclear transport factor 2 family protein [Jiangella alkaliphila]SDU11753.1 SnoaL-like domain-containing protein [Jiangella alkaliphila]
MDSARVTAWIESYERAWRTPGVESLDEVFAAGATYQQSPYQDPVVGLTAIERMWEAQRDGPDEVFRMVTEVVAVDGDTAVVRAEVWYGDPVTEEFRDLWVVRLDDDGRCTWFEEWPFAPPGRRAMA